MIDNGTTAVNARFVQRFCLLVSAALFGTVTMGAAQAHAAVALPASAMAVPAKLRAANRAYWAKLGITRPKGGLVLEHPWSRPWSGRSLVVPIAWLKRSQQKLLQHAKSGKPTLVNAAALRADLPILHLVLEKDYSGWEVAAKKGWDWNQWFQRWNATLARVGDESIPGREAFAPWLAYEKFQIDSHSGPLVARLALHKVHSESAMIVGVPADPCTRMQTTDGHAHALNPKNPAQQPHAVENWNGNALVPARYIVYPSSWGTARSLVCGQQTIAVKPFWSAYGPGLHARALMQSVGALSDGKKGLASYNTLAPGIGYLRLGSFSDAGDLAFEKLLKALPPSARHEKLLIVDLRGNGGGNAPIDLMSRWVPVNRISLKLTRVGKRSCLYPGLWFNLGQILALRVKPPGTPAFRDTMAAYANDLDRPASADCPVSFKRTHGPWVYTDHHFVRHWQGNRPRLLVLVDNMCGSDCELMTWALAQLPGTVIAGENTYGLIGFTQPGILLLPHTRLAFMVATSYVDAYGDDRSSNGYGLDVDVSLPARSDWSKRSILALAKALIAPAVEARHSDPLE